MAYFMSRMTVKEMKEAMVPFKYYQFLSIPAYLMESWMSIT